MIGSNLFAGTHEDGVLRSSDNGKSWIDVNNGFSVYTTVVALAVSGANLFASTYGGVFLSTDNGTSWTLANTGLSYNLVFCFKVIGNTIFAGTGGSALDGVYLSTDNGASWHNTALTTMYVNALEVSGGNLFAGTSDTLWRRSLSDSGISYVAQPKLVSTLLTSFPNPFTQSTSIKFSTSDHSFAQVSIHNLLGSEVARLFSGELDAGEHSFTWDAHGMPAGMYVALVKIGGEVREIPIVRF